MYFDVRLVTTSSFKVFKYHSYFHWVCYVVVAGFDDDNEYDDVTVGVSLVTGDFIAVLVAVAVVPLRDLLGGVSAHICNHSRAHLAIA